MTAKLLQVRNCQAQRFAKDKLLSCRLEEKMAEVKKRRSARVTDLNSIILFSGYTHLQQARLHHLFFRNILFKIRQPASPIQR